MAAFGNSPVGGNSGNTSAVRKVGVPIREAVSSL
jgi:hypothetical protein